MESSLINLPAKAVHSLCQHMNAQHYYAVQIISILSHMPFSRIKFIPPYMSVLYPAMPGLFMFMTESDPVSHSYAKHPPSRQAPLDLNVKPVKCVSH